MNLEERFLAPQANQWASHLPMLYLGLTITTGPVTEMGSGEGSTALLKQYGIETGRHFDSYESNKEWAERTGAIWVKNWDASPAWRKPCGLLFIDHAPGEHRRSAALHMAQRADVVVIHDSEEVGAGDYRLASVWPYYKYRLNYNRLGPGAGCTMVSNFIDVEQYAGFYHDYLFEVKK